MKLSKLTSCLVPLSVLYCGDTSCFVAGTLIDTSSGPVAIEDLKVGDLVFSYSLERRELVVRRVGTILWSTAREVRMITAGKRSFSGVTPEHPFYDVARGTYRPVRELVAGDVLATLSGEGLHPNIIEKVSAKEMAIPSIRVFNLTIDGPEANYFAEGILVHNKSPPPRPPVPPCPANAVEVFPYWMQGEVQRPGDFAVEWKSQSHPDFAERAMRSIRIDRLLPNGDREQLTPVVERVTVTVDRVRLLMPDPGSYELHLSGVGYLANVGECKIEETHAFVIDSSQRGQWPDAGDAHHPGNDRKLAPAD